MTPQERAGTHEGVLEAQGWLRRLARELTADEAGAEDLAQDALVTTLLHPPHREGALRSWLRRVLVRRAGHRASAEDRRRAREQLAARPEAAPGPDAIAERLELAREVAEALGALPEAERGALYLRYYEDLSPPDIARALGLPLGTVKSRLVRGRELLRRRLDRECGGREGWLSVLLPIAALPPAPPQSPAASAAAGTASGSLLLGVVTMATKTTVAVVAGAALVATLLVWRPWELRPAVPAAEPHGVALAEPGLDASPGAAPEAASDLATPGPTDRVAATPIAPDEPAATTGRVEVVATYASDAAPAAHLHGSLAPNGEAWMDEPPSARRFELDAAGRALVEGLEPGTWVARLNGRSVETDPVEVVAGGSLQAELSILAGLNVRGRVLDEHDAPVAGAEVFLARNEDVPSAGTLAFSDVAGGFTLRDLAPWRQSGPWTEVAARASGQVVSRTWEAMGTVGDAVEIVLRLGARAGGLQGRVVDEDGTPVAGARIVFKTSGWSWESELSSEGLSMGPPPHLRLVSAADGTFASDRLPGGRVHLEVHSDEHPAWGKQLTIEVGRTTEVEVVLETGGLLEGVVLDPQDRPAEGARVWAGFSEADGFRTVHTDAEGRYRIAGLSPGPAEAHAAVRFGREAQAQVVIVAGQTTRWDVRLPASDRVTGRLVDEAGEPLEGWGVHVIEPERNGLWLNSARTDSAGRFVLEDCPEGPKALEVRLPDPFAAPPMLLVPFPDEPEVTLVVPDSARPSAILTGRVVDPSAANVEGLELWLSAEGINWGKQVLPDRVSQAFEVGPLAPGTYRLWVQAPGFVDLSLEGLSFAPGERRDVGTLELQRGALLEVALQHDGGRSVPSIMEAQLLTPDGTVRHSWILHGDLWRSEQLTSGDYLLRIGGAAMAWREVDVQLQAGETTKVTIPVEPGTWRGLLLEGFDPTDEVTIEVVDAEGTPFHGPVTHLEGWVAIYGLTLGRWKVVARTSSGLSGELVLDVETLDEPREAIRFPLD